MTASVENNTPHSPSSKETATVWMKLAASFERGSRHWLAAIILCSAALYAQTVNFELVFDDHIQIERNQHVRSWHYIDKAFTEHLWSGQEGYGTTNSYRPFYLVWMTANYSLFGQHPRGWHVTTVLIYLMAIGCVWWLAGAVLGHSASRIVATTVFALHPAHIESVAWIAAFPDSLVMIFLVTATMLYFRASHYRLESAGTRPLKRNYLSAWGSAAFFLWALLTKEFAIFWLPMIFLYEVFLPPTEPTPRSSFRRLVTIFDALFPNLAVFAVYFMFRKAVLTTPYIGNPDLHWQAMVFTAPLILINYLKLLVWPAHLRLEYELPYVETPWSPWFWIPLGVLLLLAAGVYLIGRTHRRVWVLALWLLVPLIPALNLRLFRPGEFLHDRYLFLASLGFSLLVGWGAGKLGEMAKAKSPRSAVRSPQPAVENQESETQNSKFKTQNSSDGGLLWPTLLMAALLMVLNLVQIPVWANDTALYNNVLRYHPDNIFALGNLSEVMHDRNDTAQEITVLQHLIRLQPQEFKYRYTLAIAYGHINLQAETAEVLTFLELHDPGFTLNHSCYFLLGYAQLATGHPYEAKRHLEIAVALSSSDPHYWFALGDACAALNLRTEALQAYQAVLSLDPGSEPYVRPNITRLTPH